MDGYIRLCIDYRKQNAVNVTDAYSILQMNKCLYSLGEMCILSTLDGSPVYLHIEIDDRDED